jgi:hypothetical protein
MELQKGGQLQKGGSVIVYSGSGIRHATLGQQVSVIFYFSYQSHLIMGRNGTEDAPASLAPGHPSLAGSSAFMLANGEVTGGWQM